MTNVPEVPAPAYAENEHTPAPPAARTSEDHTDEVPPPPYEPSANPTVMASASDSKTEKPASAPTRVQPVPSKAGPSNEAESSSSGSSFSLKKLATAYDEKKKAKKAAKLVDFYEKEYGFVPKNVMTEAEWKKAKDDAPKVKVNKLKSTLYQGHYY